MTQPSILIVEDEIIVAADLANKLRQIGYTIAGCTDTGEEAVIIAGQERPSLALIDIRLAGAMDGIAAADLIRRQCDLPVIFLTAHSDTATIERARQVEPFGYILKPFEERELHTCIEMALYKHAAEQRLRDSEAALRKLNAELEQRVAERTAQLRRLTLEMIRAEERERRGLALLLHDHLQQLLVGARLRADRLRKEPLTATAESTVTQIIGLLEESIAESRSLTVQLSPPILHEAGLVEGLAWLCRWMKETHGLRVVLDTKGVHLPPGEEIATLLFQAVRELLFNVVKHAGVSEARVVVSQPAANELTIMVADHGAGFVVTNGNPGGHGFGLCNMSERLQLVGGDVTVESTPGQGTTVTLHATLAGFVPVVPGPAIVPAAKSAVPAGQDFGSRQLRVLLVDDHKVLRDGLMEMLRGEDDIEVVGDAADGRMAVDLVRKLLPDLVIMDLNMPVMNGIEATRAIRGEFPAVRVIGLSMFEEEDRAEAMIAAGATAYVSKTASTAKLLAVVREVGRCIV